MVQDTIKNLCAKYEQTSWGDMLKDILKSEEFELAIEQLVSDVQAGQPFTPVINNLFKSFDLCKLQDVKVVFIDAHPYPEKGVSKGLAFAGKVNPFVRELNDVTNVKFIDGPAPSLEYLPKIGVLLLNLAMTSPILKDGLDKPLADDHIPMWNPVTSEIIKQIAYRTVNTVFIFVGEKTEHLTHQIKQSSHRKIFIPSFNNNNDGWDSNNVFKKINKILEKREQPTIDW